MAVLVSLSCNQMQIPLGNSITNLTSYTQGMKYNPSALVITRVEKARFFKKTTHLIFLFVFKNVFFFF